MSDEQTRPTGPDAPIPPPSAPAYGGTTTLDPSLPTYVAPPLQARPRFVDQVLGMRAVVAVALASLIVGGLSGFVLGHATGGDGGRFGGRPGGFPNVQQQGTLPNAPNGIPNGQNGIPNQGPDQDQDGR
jgi:hypothetical protein